MSATPKQSPIVVLGAGSWGTALAILLARNGATVRLWDRNPQHVGLLQQEFCNNRYLPGIPFPANLKIVTEFKEAVTGVEDIFIAVPSYGFKSILDQIHAVCSNNVRIAWGTKGIDPNTHQLLHQSVQALFGEIPVNSIS